MLNDKIPDILDNSGNEVNKTLSDISGNYSSLSKIVNKNPLLDWVKKTIISIVVILFVMFINCNIIFLVKKAKYETTNLIDLWFPVECDKYPYGSEDNNTCDSSSKLNKSFCKGGSKGGSKGGNSKVNIDNIDNIDNNELGKMFDVYAYEDPPFPYNRFHNISEPSTSIDITNWLINSQAKTSINSNESIRGLFNLSSKEDTWINKVPDLIFFVFGILFLLLTPFKLLFTLFSLIYNQLSTLFQHSWLSIIIILLFWINILLWDISYSIYNELLSIIKIMFYPILMGNFPVIWKMMLDRKEITLFLISFTSLILLWNTKFNKLYDFIIKLIPTILYIILGLIEIIKLIKIRKNKTDN